VLRLKTKRYRRKSSISALDPGCRGRIAALCRADVATSDGRSPAFGAKQTQRNQPKTHIRRHAFRRYVSCCKAAPGSAIRCQLYDGEQARCLRRSGRFLGTLERRGTVADDNRMVSWKSDDTAPGNSSSGQPDRAWRRSRQDAVHVVLYESVLGCRRSRSQGRCG
jgi:hypothetical protein